MTILKRIAAVRIFVRDLDRARGFYRDLLELKEMAADPFYALFDCGGISVLVERLGPPEDEAEAKVLVGRLVGFSFAVEGDIHEIYRRLLAYGVTFEGPPEKQRWGGTLAFPRDPDNNILTLVG